MFPPDVPILTADPTAIPQQKTEYLFETKIHPETAGMSTEQLILMSLGAIDPKGILANVVGSSGCTVAGAAGESCGFTRTLGIKPLVMADGPAGLRLSKDYVVTDSGQLPLGGTLPESMVESMPMSVAYLQISW